ncbi:MAG: nicotinate-nucleotide adenylyltransferase [Methylotenera sp.]|uniref:nicotinate-nucleotide adenylyltransferase n=1 Tax=Methylotenera sp. TaxID=2051956 RepID=UPI0024890F75|nr:nicotinate-nucleotide adenylyltransferase [Methylotenera sp.]MDI1310332.1 nicotinate-nucleotide adenylyltransferase [Methylotenera sp.]
MQTIGLLGGTFNPIHFGHLRIAQELAESLSLNTVKLIPSANPPHKPLPLVSAEHRAAMVQIAIADNPQFHFDGRELNRVGASYTVDTLESLRSELGNDISLILIMGSDAFTKFNTWHRWQEIITLCHIALVQRPASPNKDILNKELEIFLHNHYTENVDDLHETSAGLVTMQAITPLEISSTAIRQALKLKHSARYLMPENVLSYILSKQLYSTVSA